MVINTKKQLRTLYDGTATVYSVNSSSEDQHGIERDDEEILHENVKCRVSFSNKNHNKQDNHGELDQTIVLYCDPDIDIPPGSKIKVTQYGATHTYSCSGLAAKYNSHQEIELTTYREYA